MRPQTWLVGTLTCHGTMATRDKRMCLPQICRCKTEIALKKLKFTEALHVRRPGTIVGKTIDLEVKTHQFKDLNATDRFYGCRALFAHPGSGQQGIQHRDCLHLPRLLDDLMLLLPKPFTTHSSKPTWTRCPVLPKKTQLRDAKLIC